jgi:Tfp pilus assembly protein PilN
LSVLIKQGQIFEEQKKAIENRIKVIENLRRNQVNPVMMLDMLVGAIDRTRYVWLSSLSQNNATFNMSGTGTSVEVLSDLVRNLESTGYFHNIILQRFQDARGNYTFSMTCEFAPPAPERADGERGAN